MINQKPKFSCLSYAMNLVTGENVEILGVQYFEGFGYGYLCRSLKNGGTYPVNEQAYYPELILSSLPLMIRKGVVGRRNYMVRVLPSLNAEFYSVMCSIDEIFLTGEKRGCHSNLIGDFFCPDYALKFGISLIMEELQNERKC